jgi:putative PEP-CTERM system TPR-repeat lipoprotein
MIRRAVLALLLAFGLAGGALPTARAALGPDDAPAFYESALALFETGDYDGAVIELRNVLQADPGHLPARLLIGRAYLRLGNPRSAEIALQRARELGTDPDHVLSPLALSLLMQGKYEDLLSRIPAGGGNSVDSRADILVARGMAFLELRQWDDAEAAFRRAGELVPDDPAPVIGRVRALLTQGRRDEAEALVEAERDLLIASDVAAWYWHVKGEAARLRGDAEAAAAHYGEALAVNPDHLAAMVGRAAARMAAGQDAGALADLERAYDLMPDEPQVAYLYAMLQAHGGDAEAARSTLTSAGTLLAGQTVEEMREHPPMLLMGGIVSYYDGMLNQAQAYLARYVAVRPHHAAARKLLGRVRLMLDDPAGAVSVLEPAAESAPDDAELLGLLGDGYLRLERTDQALAAFDAALPATARPDAVQTGRAVALLALGRPAEAREALEAALAADAAAEDAAVMLGMMHLERRRHREALDLAEALAAAVPDSPLAQNLAGGALFGLGRTDAARERFRRALALRPEFFPAHANLARLDVRDGNPELAVERFLGILEADPAEARAMLALSRLAERRGDPEAAIAWLEQYLARVDEAPEQQLRLVDLLLAVGEADMAMNRAIELRRRDSDRYAFREAEARALAAAGREAEAVDAFRVVSEFVAERPAEFSRLADLQLALDDVEGARLSLDRAVAADAGYAPAQALRARLEMDQGNADRALEIARALQGDAPGSPVGDLLVGDILMIAGDAAGAADAFAAAMEKAPNTELAWRLYRARRDAGEQDPALAGLEAWAAGRPGDYAAQRALAVAYMQQGREEAALAAHEALLAERPEDVVVLNNLALLYDGVGDPRAMELARRAYELAPEEPAAIDTLGWLLVRRGEAERGLALLREAHVRAGDNPAIRYHIAVALSRLGRTEAARSALQGLLDDGRPFDGREDARRLMEELTGS